MVGYSNRGRMLLRGMQIKQDLGREREEQICGPEAGTPEGVCMGRCSLEWLLVFVGLFFGVRISITEESFDAILVWIRSDLAFLEAVI